MRGGQLDDRITISRPTEVVDPVYGPQPGGWEVVAARVPAQLLDQLPSKSERVEGGLKVADRPARLRIRYMPGLTSDMKITLHDGADASGDRDYQISAGPADIGRREWIEFTITNFTTAAP